MAQPEVRIRISADVKDVQAGLKKTEADLAAMAEAARKAAESMGGYLKPSLELLNKEGIKTTDQLKQQQAALQKLADEFKNDARVVSILEDRLKSLASEISRTGGKLGGVATGSNGARVALTDLNRVISDAPFGFIAIQGNIDQLAGSFSRLVNDTGGVKNAVKALGASFAGPAGILALLSLAGSAAIIFGDQISAAFNKGAAEAERAQQAIKDAFDEVAKFDSISGVSFNETSAKAAIPGAKERLSLEQATSEAIQKQITDIDRQINKTNQLGAAQAAIAANQGESLSSQRKALLDQLQVQTLNVVAAQRALDGLEAQNAAYDAQNQTQQILIDLGGTLETQASERVEQLRGQTDEAKAQAKAIADAAREQEELNKLRSKAFAAVGTPTPFVQRGSTPQATTPLPGRPDKVFDETAVQDFLAAQERIRAQQEAVNAQLLQGNDIFTEFGVSGAAALADIALGFEKLADLGSIVSTIVKGLARDIAVAAAKAALLTVLFPGAAQAGGGFGKIFKGLLGIGGGAIGGAPSQSLINAPAAVAPLGRLAQASQSAQVVIPELTIRGNDLVVAFQRARAGSARTLGNIPLK